MIKSATIISILLSTAPLHAQQLVDDGVDDRIEALNAIFNFRSDLKADSTVIARCRIPTAHPDSGKVSGLDARFQALLVTPDTVQLRGMPACAVRGFADPKLRVLWLEELIEVRRTDSVGLLQEWRAHSYEVTFQMLDGPSYREFHRYVVEPTGITPLPNQRYKIPGWRVVEFRLMGAEHHWGDDIGHGSGVRLPR